MARIEDLDKRIQVFLKDAIEAIGVSESEDDGYASAAAWAKAQEVESFAGLADALASDEDVTRDWNAFPNFLSGKNSGEPSDIARNILIAAHEESPAEAIAGIPTIARQTVNYFRSDSIQIVAVSPIPNLVLKDGPIKIATGMTIDVVPDHIRKNVPEYAGLFPVDRVRQPVGIITGIQQSKAVAYDPDLRGKRTADVIAAVYREILCRLSWLAMKNGFWCWYTDIRIDGPDPCRYRGSSVDPDPGLPLFPNSDPLTSEAGKSLSEYWHRFWKLDEKEQERLNTAMEWASCGFQMNSQRMAIVYYFIALEALFLSDSHGSSETLALRLGSYLGEDQEQAMGIYKTVKRAYRYRSHAVHGFDAQRKRKLKLELGLALKLRRLTHDVLQKYLLAPAEDRFLRSSRDYWTARLLRP